MRRFFLFLLAIAALLAAICAYAFAEARRDPVVRRASVALPDWPRGTAPITVALISDVHLGSPAMRADRLSRIVAQIDALHPDLILIAGDFVFGHAPEAGWIYATALVQPLSRLQAPLGVVAVLGNHDHWTTPAAISAALAKAHILVLENEAARLGPIAIAGIGDAFTGHDWPETTTATARGLGSALVVLTHDPSLSAKLPDDVTLVLAGHTHCGQIVLPLIGAVSAHRLYDPQYRCGVIREGARTTIVIAGLGTSVVPLRIGAPPDLWLITLGPANIQRVSRSRP